MATIAYDAEAPGRGGQGPLFGAGRPQKIVTGQFSFDNSYPTGGESLSEIFDFFRGAAADMIWMEQPIQAGAQTGKFLRVNMATKKVQLFTNASPYAEVANASDQSLIAGLRFLAIGPR